MSQESAVSKFAHQCVGFDARLQQARIIASMGQRSSNKHWPVRTPFWNTVIGRSTFSVPVLLDGRLAGGNRGGGGLP
jgi:hypothetical protein